MNDTTEWKELDYHHLVENSKDKDLHKKRKKVISKYMRNFSEGLSHTSDKTSNTTKFQEIPLASKTSESDINISNAALATTANTTMDIDSTMDPHIFMSSSSSSSISPISNVGSVNDISLPLPYTNSTIRIIDFSDENCDNNDLQSSLTAQSMPQTNNEVLKLTCYLDDLDSHYAFQNHALVAKAKPCQFLRANELHFVQCMQSFLYIVCRSDPSDMGIQFFKVHFRSLFEWAHSFLFYHVPMPISCFYFVYLFFHTTDWNANIRRVYCCSG